MSECISCASTSYSSSIVCRNCEFTYCNICSGESENPSLLVADWVCKTCLENDFYEYHILDYPDLLLNGNSEYECNARAYHRYFNQVIKKTNYSMLKDRYVSVTLDKEKFHLCIYDSKEDAENMTRHLLCYITKVDVDSHINFC